MYVGIANTYNFFNMICTFNCFRKDNSSQVVTDLQMPGLPEHVLNQESSDPMSTDTETPYYTCPDHRIIQDDHVYDNMCST